MTGTWLLKGPEAYAADFRGELGLNLKLDKPGIYRVAFGIQASAPSELAEPEERFRFRVNNADLGYATSPLSLGDANDTNNLTHTATFSLLTPHLPVGEHQIGLHWDNVTATRRIKIHAFSIHRMDDEAATLYLLQQNHLLTPTTTLDPPNSTTKTLHSPVSPVFIEGQARHPELVRLQINPQSEIRNPQSHRAPQSGWYADVPLDPARPTPLQITYENGAHTQNLHLHWTPTDLSTPQTLTLRQGDTLLLTAATPANVRFPDGSHRLLLPHQPPIPHHFDQPGLHTFQTHAGALTTIHVKQAAFSIDPIVLLDSWAHPSDPREWNCTHVPQDTFLQHDPGLNLSFATSASAAPRSRLLSIPRRNPERLSPTPDELTPKYVAARLHPGGPILATAQIRPLRAWTAQETGIHYDQTLEDGSKIVVMPIVVNHPWPNLRLDSDIFAGGMQFLDGTKRATLSAADFNLKNVHLVHFLAPKKGRDVTCHRLHYYDKNGPAQDVPLGRTTKALVNGKPDAKQWSVRNYKLWTPGPCISLTADIDARAMPRYEPLLKYLNEHTTNGRLPFYAIHYLDHLSISADLNFQLQFDVAPNIMIKNTMESRIKGNLHAFHSSGNENGHFGGSNTISIHSFSGDEDEFGLSMKDDFGHADTEYGLFIRERLDKWGLLLSAKITAIHEAERLRTKDYEVSFEDIYGSYTIVIRKNKDIEISSKERLGPGGGPDFGPLDLRITRSYQSEIQYLGRNFLIPTLDVGLDYRGRLDSQVTVVNITELESLYVLLTAHADLGEFNIRTAEHDLLNENPYRLGAGLVMPASEDGCRYLKSSIEQEYNQSTESKPAEYWLKLIIPF